MKNFLFICISFLLSIQTCFAENKEFPPMSSSLLNQISEKLDQHAIFHVKTFSVTLNKNTIDLQQYLQSEHILFKNTDELTHTLSDMGKTSINTDTFMTLHNNEMSSLFNNSLARHFELNIQPTLFKDTQLVLHSTFTFESTAKDVQAIYKNQNIIHFGEILVFALPDSYTTSYYKFANSSEYNSQENYYTVVAIQLISIN